MGIRLKKDGTRDRRGLVHEEYDYDETYEQCKARLKHMYIPSPDEIKAAAAAIRATWSDEEERLRRSIRHGHPYLPSYFESDM